MADQTTNFKVSPTNYFGSDYSAFKNRLYKLALTSPEKYFELREKVLQSVQRDAINNLYDTIYKLLDEGKDKNNSSLFVGHLGGGVAPNFPKQKINEMSLSMASTLDEMIQEVVEILMPIDYNTIMSKKLAGTPITTA